MENNTPKITIKSKYFIVSGILLILIASAIVFVPQQTWKKIFSGKFFHVAAVFTSSNSGNWNDPATWGGPYSAAYPLGLDISSTTGEIYVASNDLVYVLNPNGSASTTYSVTYGGNRFSLNGLSLYQNKIFLSGGYDSNNGGGGLVQSLNLDGSYYKAYTGNSQSLPTSNYSVNSVSISPSGYIYTFDSSTNTIFKISPDGLSSTTYTFPTTIYSLYVSNSGNIYVGGNDIKVLNPDGTASTTYSVGTTVGCITMSQSGYIYYCDPSNNRIGILNQNGTASTTYNGGADAPISPSAIKVANNGKIYITDSGTPRVIVLNSNGTLYATYPITYTPVEGTDFPGANDDVIISSSATVTLTADANVHKIDIYDGYGILDLNGFTLNVFDALTGTPTTNGGTVNIIDFSSDLLVDSPITLSENTYVHNLTLVPGGTLNLNGYTIYLTGDWNNAGGLLINNGGTVNMISTTTQKILGKNTFENLKKIANVPSQLLFDSSTTTTITGNLTLKGLDGNLLSIAPTGAAYEFVSKIGGTPSYLQGAMFAVSNSSGEIYVADGTNGRIDVLNPDGTASTTYNGGTFAPITPGYVAISPTTREIYFTNSANTVDVLNPDGTASTTYSFSGLSDISGLAVSPTGYVYLTDFSNKVKILNPDGTTATSTTISTSGYINSIALSQSGELYVFHGGSGSGITILNSDGSASSTLSIAIDYASGMQISSSREIYLTDVNNAKIKIYNPNGSASTTISLIGAPADIALLISGKFYATEAISNNYYMFLYNQDGSQDSTFDSMNGGLLASPYGIVHDHSGNIYISDTSFRNIQKFDSSGNFIKFFDTTGPAILFDPRNLAVDSTNNIYIADSGHVVGGSYTGGKIVKFDSDGNYLTSVALDTLLPDTSNLPRAVAVDNSGYIYVASENGGNGHLARMLKLNSNLTLNLSTTTSYGGNPYFYPEGLTLSPSQSQLYATEDNNADIVKLNASDLSYVSMSIGPIEYPFTTPNSLAFDSSGNIFVSDGQGYILKLDSNFGFIASFGQAVVGDGRDGEIGAYTKQIMVDSNNDVYITDPSNKRVQKFTKSNFSPFQIRHTNPTSNNISLSYLAVSSSNNISSSPFVCTSGCTNGGFNSNWTFATIPSSGGKRNRADTQSVIYTTNPSITTPRLNSILISPIKPTVSVPPTTTFVSTTLDQFGNPFDTTTNWISSNTSVGTINSSGLFTALSAGTTTITATAGTLSTSTVVTVKAVLSSISISPLNPNVIYRATAQFVSSPVDQFGNPFATTTKWKSSRAVIGTINTSGLFTAKTTRGTTIITGTAGTFSATTTANVARAFAASGAALADIASETVSAPVETTGVITYATTTVSTTTATSEVTNTVATTSTSTTNNLVSNITNSIVAGYQNSIITPADIQKVKDVVTSPVGNAVTKTVSAAGIVAGAGASLSAVAFANPISFAEIWLLPAKLFGLLMGAMGIRRKNKQWGTVYDSVTKRPLDPVYVSLINTETNKEVASAITDIDGRYGFLVLPGKYRVEAKKTNYIGPSVKMAGKSFDEVYNDLYFGNEIVIEEEGQTITKNIPMDSLSFDWNEFAKTKMNVNAFMKEKDITWAKISKFVFLIGAIVSFIAVIFAPAPYNLIVALFYILAYILNFIVFKSKKSGTLIEKNTNIPLSFAIIKIFREGEDSPITKKIADKFGAYYALLPNGKYYMEIDEKETDGSYKKILKTDSIEVKKGIINMDFAI
jgi:sugar lactone lactonase YvrE